MDKTFESGGRKYSIDKFGVIHQEDAKPFVYDASYAAVYDTPDYQKKSVVLSVLRLGWVLQSFGLKSRCLPQSLVDVGYGNGAFLKEASRVIPRTGGVDVCHTPPPDGSEWVLSPNGFDVATFWDSLEHHPDLGFLKTLQCRMLILSVPWCPEAPGPLFDEWKHRKPDEHLHHFNRLSLKRFMGSMGWSEWDISRHEDLVRTPWGPYPNILSMGFTR